MTENKGMEEGVEQQGRRPQIVGHPLEGVLSASSGVPSVRPERIPSRVRTSSTPLSSRSLVRIMKARILPTIVRCPTTAASFVPREG